MLIVYLTILACCYPFTVVLLVVGFFIPADVHPADLTPAATAPAPRPLRRSARALLRRLIGAYGAYGAAWTFDKPDEAPTASRLRRAYDRHPLA